MDDKDEIIERLKQKVNSQAKEMMNLQRQVDARGTYSKR